MQNSKYLILYIGLLFFAFSILHHRKLIKPSRWTGYSAKGHLLFGVGFTLAGASLIWAVNDVIQISLVFVYVVCVFSGIKYERIAREVELNKSLNTDADDVGSS